MEWDKFVTDQNQRMSFENNRLWKNVQRALLSGSNRKKTEHGLTKSTSEKLHKLKRSKAWLC